MHVYTDKPKCSPVPYSESCHRLVTSLFFAACLPACPPTYLPAYLPVCLPACLPGGNKAADSEGTTGNLFKALRKTVTVRGAGLLEAGRTGSS